MAKRLHKNQKERISTDMYLKSILEYELDNGKKSKPIEIVKSLNLTKGSVSEMIKKLEEENYIKYESYGEINLTEKGLKRAKNVKKKYPKIHISGFNDGFFWDNEKQLIKRINKLKPKILLIGMTSPTQEMFVQKYGNSLNVKLIILLGGSFDVLSGKLQRAPILLQNMGLEWAFRLAQEPRRLFWRYLTTNSQFIYMVLKQYLRFK